VRVAAGPVQLQVPHVKYGEHGREPLAAWVIHVREIDPPAGQEPLEWILLSNVPTATRQQAWERVNWYECRPIIEEYHKAQKTGCGMERPQPVGWAYPPTVCLMVGEYTHPTNSPYEPEGCVAAAGPSTAAAIPAPPTDR
jgi:hypothetical protein